MRAITQQRVQIGSCFSIENSLFYVFFYWKRIPERGEVSIATSSKINAFMSELNSLY